MLLAEIRYVIHESKNQLEQSQEKLLNEFISEFREHILNLISELSLETRAHLKGVTVVFQLQQPQQMNYAIHLFENKSESFSAKCGYGLEEKDFIKRLEAEFADSPEVNTQENACSFTF